MFQKTIFSAIGQFTLKSECKIRVFSQGSMISVCLEQLMDGCPRLAQWACVSLGRLWRQYDAARWAGVRDLAHEKLYPLLHHAHPEVRRPGLLRAPVAPVLT